MAVDTIGWHGTDTSRNLSEAVWGKFPVAAARQGGGGAFMFFDDFLSSPITPATTEGNFGQYTQFSSTGGTITNDTTEVGGAIALGSDGDNEGASIRTLVTPFKLINTAGQFCFEARVLSSTITDTKHGFFLGLTDNTAMTATSPIAAAGTLADLNFVGFHRLEGDGDALDTVYKADGVTQVTVQADAVVLAAATYVKVGMKLTPSGDRGGAYTLSFYANGVRLTSHKVLPSAAGTDFPNDVGLGLCFAVLNATASTPGTSSLDWWAAGQVLNAGF